MDMRPIQPGKVDLIRPTISTANDGGSKSQGGYINIRGDDGDKIEISEETKRLLGEDAVEVEETNPWNVIKEFFLSLITAILKFFGLK